VNAPTLSRIRPRRRGRRVLIALVAVMVVALAGAGFIAAAVHSETGSRLLWTAVSQLTPGLRGTFVEGTWLDGVKLTGVQ